MTTTLRTMQESEISPALNAALVELVCLANPTERELYSHGRGWHGVQPSYCNFIELDGQPIAYVGVADRTIRIKHGPGVPPMSLRVAGVQNVSVHPAHRGRAYSLAALTCAMNHALLQNYDAGLLFCVPELERLYAKNGWRTIHNPITRSVDGRDQPLPQHNIAMFLPLRMHEFPSGPVHLQGNDW